MYCLSDYVRNAYLFLKMTENLQNSDNILGHWAKDKVQKGLVEAVKRYEKRKEENLKITRAVSVGSRTIEAKPGKNWS